MFKFLDREIPEALGEILNPSHTVLVIHDMQNDPCRAESPRSRFAGPIDCYGITPQVLKLRDSARNIGVKVMYTQYTNQPSWKSTSDFELYKMRDKLNIPDKPVPESSVYGTWGWEIIDELKPAPNETRIFKYRRDTFIGTNFDNLLRLNGIKTIVSCGIALEAGILPTAVTASQMDYFVLVPRDAVSGRHKDFMDDAMRVLERTVIVTTMEEIIKAWNHLKKPN
jgi:nicotinamidase-related amidase